MNILKSFFLFTVCSVILLSSCSSDDEDVIETPKGKVAKTFSVESPSTIAESRTMIDGFKRSSPSVDIIWQTGDQISVFPELFELKDGVKTLTNSENNLFSFVRTKKVANDGVFSGSTTTPTVAESYVGTYAFLYPYQEGAEITLSNNNKDIFMHCTIPSTQTATNGTFDRAAGIQVGKCAASAESMTLSHVCTYFYIDVDKGCSKIELEATDPTWYLAGTAIINTFGGTLEGFDSNPTNKITLNNPDRTAGTYFIASIPTIGETTVENTIIYSSPIKVTVYNPEAGKKISKTIKGGDSYTRGTFYSLGTVKFFEADGTTKKATPTWTADN